MNGVFQPYGKGSAMPSPFPGMDPYLEAPDIWPDLREALAGEMRAELNLLLPQPYYARLEVRPEVGIVDNAGTAGRIVPDVTVVKPRDAPTAPATVTVSERRATLSASVEVIVASESLRHQVVEIRDASRGHKLITLIEIVSPSNKRAGVDRRAYLRKQREVLESDASLVEIDLLRAGERLLPLAELEAGALAPSMVSRRAARGRRAGGWGDAAAARGEKRGFGIPIRLPRRGDSTSG
jgi:hypothetical protein